MPDVKAHFKTIREESSQAAWWSWFLLSLSLVYAVARHRAGAQFHRAVRDLCADRRVTLSFFFIGILAPAMVIWTAPTIHLDSGDLNFVVQHQVRGIFAIIWELLTGGHWIIGGFLMLFSVVTPLTKATLTFFITASRSKELNLKLGTFLHAIGKWSMADVFRRGRPAGALCAEIPGGDQVHSVPGSLLFHRLLPVEPDDDRTADALGEMTQATGRERSGDSGLGSSAG